MNDRARGRSTTCHGRFTACGLALLTLTATAWTGCSQTEPVRTESSPPDRVELTLVDRAEFDAVLARLAGKVVLVDCWATWCGPCVEQLPHSVKLANEHRDAGLAVVTFDFDDSDAAEQVRMVLSGTGAAAAGVTNLQSRLGSSTESMDAFEIASGALPHYKLFDRQGKLRYTFALDPAARKQYTPADVDAAVAELLAN